MFLREKAPRHQFRAVFECPALTVSHENYGLRAEDKFAVCLEQTDDHNVLQLRLSAVGDQMKVYLATVDDSTYNKLKQEQGLHVSYAGFAEQLVSILDSCQRGELFAGLFTDNSRTNIQFYEKRAFRNLVHLYLPISEAPVEVVLMHINQSMLKLKELHAVQKNQVDALRSEVSVKDETNRGLRDEIKRLKNALAEQENMVFARNMEEVKNLQHSLKNLNELKDNDERQLKGVIFGLQEKVERLTQENNQLNEKCSVAEKRSESFHSECSRAKQQLSSAKEQLARLQSELEGQKTRDRKQELNLLDLKRQLKDARDKSNALEKQRSDLIAELEAEKIVCQTKRQALQVATEEITKANDIIVKLSREVAQFKRKGEERTAIALKQEEIIQKLEADMKKVRAENEALQKSDKAHLELSNDVQGQLAEMQEFSNKMEEQYKQKILDLERKLATSNRMMNNPNQNAQRLLTGCRPPVFDL